MAAQNRDPIRNKQRSHSTTINSRFLSTISVNYFQFQRTPASARSGKRYSHPPAVTRAFFSPSGKVLSFPSKVRKKRRKKKKKTEGTRRRTVRKQRDVPLHLRGTHSLYLRVSSSGIDEGKLDKTGEGGDTSVEARCKIVRDEFVAETGRDWRIISARIPTRNRRKYTIKI